MYDYAERFRQYGDSHDTVGYRKETQLVRFKELSSIGDMKGASILDLGCGLCHLMDFLAPLGIASYEGVDRVPEFVDAMWNRAPKHPVSRGFECIDVMEYSAPACSFDYVMMCGIFNEGNLSEKDMALLIRRAFRWARKGVAFNFLSTQTAMPDKNLQYIGPVGVWLECANITRSVRMNCCYMLPSCDTSVFLYKENS